MPQSLGVGGAAGGTASSTGQQAARRIVTARILIRGGVTRGDQRGTLGARARRDAEAATRRDQLTGLQDADRKTKDAAGEPPVHDAALPDTGPSEAADFPLGGLAPTPVVGWRRQPPDPAGGEAAC
jgi:hypothetical protein